MLRTSLLLPGILIAAATCACDPWDIYPCLALRCGDQCTLCDHTDYECMKTEQPHFCDADGGSCVPLLSFSGCSPGHREATHP